MDKYEFKLKLDEIKALEQEKRYEEGAQIASTINWRKVKNINTLIFIGELYEHAGMYDECKAVLLIAYEKSPIGRMIIYKLAEISLETQCYVDAREYYDEFVKIAPMDNLKYSLNYRIRKVEGASTEELITILEELKEKEYSEEWAFELAYLYHTAGEKEKCVEVCDELILWFGEGSFVERAMELKMLYQPLTKSQEEKYRAFKEKRENVVEVRPTDKIETGEIISKTVKIPSVVTNPSKFNTINLQKELAKSMEKIMNSKEHEVEEIPATEQKEITKDLRETTEEVKNIMEETQEEEIKSQEEEMDSQEETTELAQENIGTDILREEEDGQIGLLVPDHVVVEKQITGQLSIDEILAEWEESKKAAEAALEAKNLEELEEARRRTLKEAEKILDELSKIIPELNEEISKLSEECSQTQEEIQTTFDSPKEPAIDEVSLEEEELKEELKEELVEEIENISEEEVPLEESEQTIEEKIAAVFENEGKKEEDTLFHKSKFHDEVPQSFVALPEEQKAIFSYFIPVANMEQQICKVLEDQEESFENEEGVRNFVIEGSQGSGKTMLATCMVKAFQNRFGWPNEKVGKINGDALNKKDLLKIEKKLEGGTLIIEKASKINKETATNLGFMLSVNAGNMLVILEDDKSGIRAALSRDVNFASVFTNRIKVPIFSIDDLVVFAKSYANEMGYEVEEIGVLAIYDRLSKIQKLNQATKLEEVKDIINEAIAKSNKRGLKGVFGKMIKKEDTERVLREKDFQ